MFGQDLRFAFRTLTKYRGFTAVAVLTLGIALGATTAIFSVVNAILLRPLPFAAPERLVNIAAKNRVSGSDFDVYSYPNYYELRTQTKTLEHVAAFMRGRSFLMEGTEPQLMSGLAVTANIFPMLGVKPALGRVFTEQEDRAGAPKLIVISHRLWQNAFGGDRAVIGRSIHVGTAGDIRTVIGVMPPGFRFPVGEQERDYLIQFEENLNPNSRTQRDSIFIDVVGKTKPGVPLAQVNADLLAISDRLAKQYPTNDQLTSIASSMHENVVRGVRPALLMLLAAVIGVLLIGCANVANLQLARATGRYKEIAVRAAIGASRGRIVRQLLVESVVLAALAGAFGLLLSAWGVDLLIALAPPEIPRLDTVTLDGKVLAFSAALSVFTGILFGLAPALSASRPNLTESLKEGSRGSTEGRQRNRMRGVLVVVAVALSLVLLAGAGLLLRSFMHITGLDPGYDYKNAIALNLSARSLTYKEEPQIIGFYDRLTAAIRAIPGVQSVGAADSLPLSSNETVYSFNVIGRPPLPPSHSNTAKTLVITPGFMETMRIPLLKGRNITARDDDKSPDVMVVNQEFKRQFFPNEEIIGKRITFDEPEDAIEIVGVVGDIRWRGVTEDVPASVYVPHAQAPRRSMSIVVRAPNASTLAPELRAALQQIDRAQPIISIETLEAMRGESLATRRFNLILLGILATLALLLSAGGIFSVMSYTVTQRTSEIGIRMAIGARAADIFRLIVGHTARLVGLGVAIGVAVALATTRVMSTFLYGIKPTDPATFAVICVVIAAVALLASYLPARRAAHVDPLVAIRHE